MIKTILYLMLVIVHTNLLGLTITASYDYKRSPEDFFTIQDSSIAHDVAKKYSKYLYEALISHRLGSSKDSKIVEADKSFLRVIIYGFKNINSILYSHSVDYKGDYKYHLIGDINSDSIFALAITKLLDYKNTNFLLFYFDRIKYNTIKEHLSKIKAEAVKNKNYYVITDLIIYYHNIKLITNRDLLLQTCRTIAKEEYYNQLVEFLKSKDNVQITGMEAIVTIYNW